MATGDDLADLKNLMKELIADLRHIFRSREEQRDLLIIELFFGRLSPESIMNHMIKKVLPYRKIIAERDASFFINHNTLFQSLPRSRANHYKEFWKRGTEEENFLSVKNKEAIWAYFDAIVEIAKGYKKIN